MGLGNTFFYCYLGFFVIYYFVFLVSLIYIAVIEEWCCKNRIPRWYIYSKRIVEQYNVVMEDELV